MSLFFMLSGFLIGRGLLQSKNKPFRTYYTNYFINRCLRIFPLYFASIAVIMGIIYFLSFTDDKWAFTWNYYVENIKYYIFYGVNCISIFEPSHLRFKFYNMMGHFWSLSVEEQFYFIFPFFIFFFSKKNIIRICISLVILIPMIKGIMVLYMENYHGYNYARIVSYQFILFWLDAFALGCLANFIKRERYPIIRKITMLMILFTLSIGTLIYGYAKYHGIDFKLLNFGMDLHIIEFKSRGHMILDYRFMIMGFLTNIAFFLVILCSIFRKPIAKFLENKWMVFIGKRAYGIYVFHLPILLLFHYYKVVDLDLVQSNSAYNIIGLILYTLFVIFISHLSYTYFEKPILKFKRKY